MEKLLDRFIVAEVMKAKHQAGMQEILNKELQKFIEEQWQFALELLVCTI